VEGLAYCKLNFVFLKKHKLLTIVEFYSCHFDKLKALKYNPKCEECPY